MERIVVVRPQEDVETRQGLRAFVGVCGGNCEATGLSMNLVVVPPGAVSEPHYHDGFETAIYQLSGRVETRYGPGLGESVMSQAGDFLFIPPGLPHQVHNLSEVEPATAIIARNDPNEQESVVLYQP
jgi:uncharacterized RmlC-like cupin family protein